MTKHLWVSDEMADQLQMSPSAERFLTTAEIAARFRTSPDTVRYWRHLGKGPRSFKVGRRVLYPVSDVLAWEQEQQAGRPA